ncbi:MAG: NUDIX hydrolase [Thermodesulfobacteriota bacterium]|nr:NUDIX hydrolase [Thermodesulfobacteriota bacterium]
MSVKRIILCPECGHEIYLYHNPVPTVDMIIEYIFGQDRDGRDRHGIVLVYRRNTPHGWALPGGFVDYGETLETAATREAKEETGLDLKGLQQFHCYSDPSRDPRSHTITTVFTATGTGVLRAGDDAKQAKVFDVTALPDNMVFDHAAIIRDYATWKNTGKKGLLY